MGRTGKEGGVNMVAGGGRRGDWMRQKGDKLGKCEGGKQRKILRALREGRRETRGGRGT